MDELKKEIEDLKKRIRMLEEKFTDKFTYNDKNSSDVFLTQAEKVLKTGRKKLRKALNKQ